MSARIMLAALGLALAACSVPHVNDRAGGGGTPTVMGTRGPLTDAQSKAIFAKLGVAADDPLQRHLAVEQAVAETPLIAGNSTKILRNGDPTFRAMFAAMRAAKKRIDLEYFTFEDVSSDNVNLSDLLIRKRQQGVAVNVIYDGFGSVDTPAEFFERLRQAGVQIVEFHPLDPLHAVSVNDRDHRKILIVDGATAIVGGVNLSTSYLASPSGRRQTEAQSQKPWRDTDMEINGPAVAQLEKLFVAHWNEIGGPALDDTGISGPALAHGQEAIRIIGSTPNHDTPRYYVTVLSAIRAAQKEVWLTAAYFVPTHQEMEDLIHAARRGVDVRILVPDDSDSPSAIKVQRSRYGDLLEAGIKVYETQGEVLHSKTIVIDGVWSVIGSSNFDHRSVLFNDEVDAVILGKDTAGSLKALFQDDISRAKSIDLATWEDRPVSEKFEEWMTRIWESML